jgi:hypothetical protein
MADFTVLRSAANFGLALAAVLCITGGQAVAQPVPVIVVNAPTSLDHTVPRVPEVLALPGADQGVVLYSSSRWRLLRRVPSGYLDVYTSEGDTWRRLELALEWRRNTHPMLAMESPQGLLVVGYDVIANLPSGRRLGAVREGFDLYLLGAAPKGQPQRLAENLQLGGIDTLLYGAVRGEQVDLCGGNRCLTVDAKRRVVPWALDALAAYDLVELAFRGQSALALVRKKTIETLDAHSPIPSEPFQLAMLAPTGTVLQPLPVNEGIPWGVEWRGGSGVLRIARRAADYAAVLRYDLARMPFAGAMDFGANNQEGRVAWSQVYYLQGLVSLLRAHPATDAALREAVRIRLVAEAGHTARLAGAIYPGLAARRYSIDREPLLFALHLGRVAHLLGNMRAAGISSPALERASSVLQQQLLTLDETVERQVALSSTDKGLPTLAYRRGVPFWADGANVPHNYISGYLSGLLANGGTAGIARARQLARFILGSEFSGNLPVSWRYWAATGDVGWQEQSGISLNTPAWGGNRGALAHVTYRSMDAVSLAQLQRQAPDVVPRKLVDHFADLTARGWLLPFVNEELRIQDRVRSMEAAAGRYYSRSTAAWELQSQVAAMRDMARTP